MTYIVGSENLQDLQEYASRLFSRFNLEVCSSCPQASYVSTDDALKAGIGFSKEAGCCTHCRKYDGFFGILPTFEEGEGLLDLSDNEIIQGKLSSLKEKYGFDEKYGFFDMEERRCRLSIQDRGVLCSYYYCPSVAQLLTDMDKENLFKLRVEMLASIAKELGVAD